MRAREIQVGMPVTIDHNNRNTGIVMKCMKVAGFRYSYCDVMCSDGHSRMICVNRINKYTTPVVRRTITIDVTSVLQRLREEGERIMYSVRY